MPVDELAALDVVDLKEFLLLRRRALLALAHGTAPMPAERRCLQPASWL
jgi:hypothetical protein